MQTIPLAEIIVPSNRQRVAFDEDRLLELANDIFQNGLFHPILLQADGRTLVAGERRLRAISSYIFPLGRTFEHDGSEVPMGTVPFAKLGTKDAIGVMAAEYAENAIRSDLTWQEQAAAQAALHALRCAQNPTQTVAETALEVHGRADGEYHTKTKVNLILSDHLDNPEVAKAKTAKDAFKILVRQEETSRHSALAEAVGKTYSAEVHRAYHVNCLDWMRDEVPDGGMRFDVILTDPPYGMGADKFGDAAGKLSTITHEYDDSFENFMRLMHGDDQNKGWCHLSYLVAKPQAHAYVFCDPDNFGLLRDWMREAGWYVFRTPLINVKESGRVPLPDQGPRRQYEICLYAIKGQKHTTGIFSDVIHSTADEQMGHGAQKPVSLYIDLLRRSARPGDTVLDAFSGSGTIFPACQELKCKAVGLEANQASYGKGLERLASLKAAPQGELPI